MNDLPTSARLSFREIVEDDLVPMQEFFSSEEALRFLKIPVNDPQAPKTWLERQQWRYETYGMGLWALTDHTTNTFVGNCGLLIQEVAGKQELEIGYHLLPSQWKKGYATEAAIACKNFAFERNMASSIISIIDKQNFNSQAVAKRNGMKVDFETRWRDFDVYIFRIKREEWLPSSL